MNSSGIPSPTGRPGRRASISGIVMVVLTILALLVGALMVRVSGLNRTVQWESSQLAARHLTESAAEEIFGRLQLEVNANTAVARFLRGCNPGDDFRLNTGHPSLDAELVSTGRSGSVQYACLDPAVHLRCGDPLVVGGDPREVRGMATIDVAVQQSGGLPRPLERVVVERPFKVCRVSLTAAAPDALFVGRTEPSVSGCLGYPPADSSPMALRLDSNTSQSIGQMLENMQLTQLPSGPGDAIQASMRSFSPESLRLRAQRTFHSAAALQSFLMDRLRSGLPVSGVIHHEPFDPADTLVLEFSGREASPSFHGSCMITSNNLICVKDVRLRNSVDRLSIVSTRRIDVRGRRVEAGLWCLGNRSDNEVRFWQSTSMAGPVYSGVFPRGSGLSRGEFSSVSFGVPRDENPQLAYVVAFSPNSSSTVHSTR